MMNDLPSCKDLARMYKRCPLALRLPGWYQFLLCFWSVQFVHDIINRFDTDSSEFRYACSPTRDRVV